ncbi:hypothetical protein CRG98_005282 [Punica granatum]|uniref:Exonuclease domain-containing protein n=1 Tax=Punica granatum TaxID=22663 RepID=A0A2I0L2B7_PUNGR|nr:hypothetical protein CRG98_005282 [Punica granatum]
MRESYHSVHQPRCGVCQKHCKSFESLREHLSGPLAKANCAMVFSNRGCDLCLKVFDNLSSLNDHQETCYFLAPPPLFHDMMDSVEGDRSRRPSAIAMDCEMVGGGIDGTLNLCARVCLIDEDENIIFHTYVQPQIAVTNYRYEVTGLTEDHLKDGMPLKEVKEKILEILYYQETITRVRLFGGKARLLVGHDLEHDFKCLNMCYPDHLLRYDIQMGVHDPYEDCVSVMRIYKRMRAQEHPSEQGHGRSPSVSVNDDIYDPWRLITSHKHNPFWDWSMQELVEMSPDELYKISRSNYQCWCLDLNRTTDLRYE